MQPSRFNIIAPLKNGDAFFIVNPLSGSADAATSGDVKAIEAGEERPDLLDKGYVVEPAEEERRFRRAYLDFLDARENDELQLFYAPWYDCNFGCAYCYQGGYDRAPLPDPEKVIESFFNYADAEFGERRKYVTIFGGEPLLPSAAARRTIGLLLEGAARRGLDTAIVTNGYTLESYLPLFAGRAIREVQVTLDGPAGVHDARRPLRGGGGTFARVAAGIDAALAAGLPVNLRFNLDALNIASLADLAREAIGRGWTKSPLFKTQVGRVYELHSCLAGRDALFTRLGLYEALAAEIAKHPEILEFHQPGFSVARFLFENGRLPSPLFDACPGTKTEWAFDGAGRIFSCTATVGKSGEELGRFFPETYKDEKLIERLRTRDVTAIDRCRGCSVSLVCGGGCAAVAKNKEGDWLAPDCRPVRELLSLGADVYFAGSFAAKDKRQISADNAEVHSVGTH